MHCPRLFLKLHLVLACPSCPHTDEHYFPTLLAFHGLDNETDCQGKVMDVDWNRVASTSPHPWEYQPGARWVAGSLPHVQWHARDARAQCGPACLTTGWICGGAGIQLQVHSHGESNHSTFLTATAPCFILLPAAEISSHLIDGLRRPRRPGCGNAAGALAAAPAAFLQPAQLIDQAAAAQAAAADPQQLEQLGRGLCRTLLLRQQMQPHYPAVGPECPLLARKFSEGTQKVRRNSRLAHQLLAREAAPAVWCAFGLATTLALVLMPCPAHRQNPAAGCTDGAGPLRQPCTRTE